MDHDWIKNLAASRLVDGQLVAQDTEAVKRKATASLLDVINNLIQELEDAVNLFNTYRQDSPIRVLPLAPDPVGTADGVILMANGCQVTAEQNDYRVDVFITIIEEFEKKRRKHATFTPKIDRLGGLFWKTEGKSEMTLEMLACHLLKLICIHGRLLSE